MAYYLNKITSMFSQSSKSSNKKEENVQHSIMFLNPNNPNKKPPPSSFTDVFDLFLNELIIDWIDDNECNITIDDQNYPCKVLVTEYRLLLLPYLPQEILSQFHNDYFIIPIFSITTVDKSINKLIKITIKIETNDNRHFSLLVPFSSNIYNSILISSRPSDSQAWEKVAWKSKDCYHSSIQSDIDGWSIYDPIKEYERQGIKENPRIKFSYINKNFEVCKTYPEIVYLPNIDDEDIKAAALYRTKSRFPALAYYNRKSHGSIWRSSQNKAGIMNGRNNLDEKILNSISEISSEEKNKLIIYDARPMISAYANRLKGAGFENIENYKNTQLIFCEIDNIHAVRQSYSKLQMMLSHKDLSSDKNFFSQFELTGWPTFIYQLITYSINISEENKKGHAVLIHCSDGWDRASQLTALSQLIIDPYYRTIEGFIILIEKEFLSFGHRFKSRLGLFPKGSQSDDEISPVFLQWLDCVHQLVILYPFAFEFNIELLCFIAYHLTTCKYGNFLWDCALERKEKKCKERTLSIWTDVMNDKDFFTNAFYDEGLNNKVNITKFCFRNIRLWEEYYMRNIKRDINYEGGISLEEWRQRDKRNDIEIINQLKTELLKKSNNI